MKQKQKRSYLYDCKISRRGCHAHAVIEGRRNAPSVQPVCQHCGVKVCGNANCSTRVNRNYLKKRASIRVCHTCFSKMGTFLCEHCGLNHHISNCWVKAERRDAPDKYDRWVDKKLSYREPLSDVRAKVSRKLRQVAKDRNKTTKSES